MAKGMNRGNREAKKPKKDKTVTNTATPEPGASRFPTPQKTPLKK
ncbi:hypothetical protein [Paenochrobactrum pullorum]